MTNVKSILCKKSFSGVIAIVLVLSLCIAPANQPVLANQVSGVTNWNGIGDWQYASIGNTKGVGETKYDAATEVFTQSGYGGDMGWNADSMNFSYIEMSGDFEFIAKTPGIPNDSPEWTKSGLMIRTNLTAESQNFAVLSTANRSRGFIYSNRWLNGAGSNYSDGTGNSSGDYWLKLTKIGNVISGYYSKDGANWTRVKEITMEMPDDFYIGFCLSNYGIDTATTVQFNNVVINTTVENNVALTSQKISSTVTVNGEFDENFWIFDAWAQKQASTNYCDTIVTFGTAWDDTNLYILAKVADYDMYYFGTGSLQPEGSIVLSIDGETFEIPYSGSATAGITKVVKDTDNGYNVEAAIPWTSVETVPSQSSNVSFGLAYSSNGTGISWTGKLTLGAAR